MISRWAVAAFLSVCTFFAMHAEHFVTYIIPCYNCEKWIEEAVASIYEQDLHCPFEVICTDDGSQDNTYQVLLQLAQKYPEFFVHRHVHNRGGSCARNTCVAHSRGDLIFCLDADNFLEKNSVQKLIDHMDATGHDVVTFGGIQYFVDKEEEGKSVHKRTDLAPYSTKDHTYRLKDLFRCSATPPWSGNYLYTKRSYEQVGGYPEGLTIDTFAFGFLQLYHYFKMSYVPETYYWHRHGIEGYYIRSSRNHRISLDFFYLLKRYHHVFTEESLKTIDWELDFFYENQKWNLGVIGVLDDQCIKLKKPFRTYPKEN